ncbi:MAG: guanine deaminase [Burkholderiales bacterium]
MTTGTLVWRAPAIAFRADPFAVPPADALVHEPDAMLVVRDGRIVEFGAAEVVRRTLAPDVGVEHFPNGLLLPGFIDTHVHYPQLGIVGASGQPLLGWLSRFTFPAERAFADPVHAGEVARRFIAELQRHGTTTAMVFGTVHAGSADALFEAAEPSGLRIIGGKTLMDRNTPPGLSDTAQSGYDASKRLIEQWHGRGRLGYAITPRFVATSSPAQLDAAAALWREFPGTWLQSHVSENLDEVAWVHRLFPEAIDYVDVLDRFGLLAPRAVYGHGIHLSDRERRRLGETGTAIAHCPTSNLFLGSGLFDLAAMQRSTPRVPVALATDVGAGTTLSMLHTMGAACQIAQLRRHPMTPSQALWLATGGAARAIGLGDVTGNLRAGLDADAVLLDRGATPLLAWRSALAEDAESLLGVLMTLGDDRTVGGVLAGGRVVKRPSGSGGVPDPGS